MTRHQVLCLILVQALITGEVGFTVILAVVYGGNAVGLNDLPLWPTA